MTNREWIAMGNTGCTFATLFAKDPESVGWKWITHADWQVRCIPDCLLLSIEFINYKEGYWNKDTAKDWALRNGFYMEDTSNETEGLRYKGKYGVSWVQYFGPDSHVVTRQTPNPMLTFTMKLNTSHYFKVGFNGILHLAHAFTNKISERVYDLLWERSFKQVCKKIGHKLTIKEAAKTAFMKEKT